MIDFFNTFVAQKGKVGLKSAVMPFYSVYKNIGQENIWCHFCQCSRRLEAETAFSVLFRLAKYLP